jgi:ankyrin repeat protein
MKLMIRIIVCVCLALAGFVFAKPCTSQTSPEQTRACGNPLLQAIQARDSDGIRRLINQGTDLNKKLCPSGTTVLIEALGEGLVDAARDLILAGANPNIVTNDGTSPLMLASWGCSKDLVSLLLKKNAEVNPVNHDGYSALMYAAGAPNCTDGTIVALLIRAGARVNEKSNTGRTALLDATWEGNETAVLELVGAGADLTAKTKEGSALELAKNREVGRKPSHDRIASFLEIAQASRNN